MTASSPGKGVAPFPPKSHLGSPGEEPRSHEIFNHAAILGLVLDGVRVVQIGLLKES
jgi:hypothetical protein